MQVHSATATQSVSQTKDLWASLLSVMHFLLIAQKVSLSFSLFCSIEMIHGAASHESGLDQ